MSASLTSGTYGRQPAFGASLVKFAKGFYDTLVGVQQQRAAEIISRVREAEDLRAYAFRVAPHSRGFADDLYAAADRHERQAD